MKLDSIDLAIIGALLTDARTTFTEIAEKTGISTSAVRARFERMKRDGLIIGSTVDIDLYKIGEYMIQLAIKSINHKTKEVVNHIYDLKIPNTNIYCWEGTGCYNIFCLIVLKNPPIPPLKMHLIRNMIQQHPAVVQVRSSICTSFCLYSENISLGHLLKK